LKLIGTVRPALDAEPDDFGDEPNQALKKFLTSGFGPKSVSYFFQKQAYTN